MTLTEFLLARIADDAALAKLSIAGHWRARLRVLAECAAKRAIVEYAQECDRMLGAEPVIADHFLRILAVPYADHPDYREEWRP
jgi:hypothetical protein